MSTLTIRAVGLDKLQTGFNQYAKALQPVSLAAIEKAMQAAEKKSPGWQGGASYTTPERQGQSYVRTGNLGRSSALIREGLSYRLKVEAYRDGREYGGYVVGDAAGAGQAWMHAGRWPTLRSAVDEQVEILTQAGGTLETALSNEALKDGLR